MRYGRVLPSEPITDFAVLELEAPLDARFADIRPLCLPKPSEQLPIYYMAFGYGSTDPNKYPIDFCARSSKQFERNKKFYYQENVPQNYLCRAHADILSRDPSLD
ncbi:unnamed protein product [Toxocara canis]|uniref:Peptidase_S9 domain-containing protein n=1 Tax=Toxocara canis TaxID=6265 RepID=A0A183VGI5_TOXCA|nr:unnamed protein product [Toxocara canis]